MASKKVNHVLQGIKNLTPDEVKDLVALLADSDRSSVSLESRRITESTLLKASTMHMGDSGGGACPCCS